MNTFTVMKRLIKQIAMDKRSIALMLLGPIFVLFLLYIVLTSATTSPKIDTVLMPKQAVQLLKKNAQVHQVDSEKAAIDDLKTKGSIAYIKMSNHRPDITVEGTDPKKTRLALAAIQKSLTEQLSSNQAKPTVHYLYGSSELGTFDSLAPILMGFFIFFFVFLISGISFLRERLSGTLSRTLATPLKRWEIVVGYFFGFGIFVAIQTILIQAFIVYGLKVPMEGSFWWLLILNLLIATVALSIGLFLSAFARNEFQLFQFIPLVIVPQILFSGLFDLTQSPKWVWDLSRILPLTYAAQASRDIMLRGRGFEDIMIPLAILFIYSAVFLILNTLALKKYRKV